MSSGCLHPIPHGRCPQPECGCWLLSVSVRGEEGRYYLLLASHPTTTRHTTQLHTDMETRLDNHPIFAVLVPACMEESAHCNPVPPLTLHCTVCRHPLYLLIYFVSTVYINQFIDSFSEMASSEIIVNVKYDNEPKHLFEFQNKR